jgi:hypothetical protein
MKKMLFIAALILSIASAKANHNASELSLELSKPGNYTIIIDGIAYHNVSKTLFIPNIEPGVHHIETIKHVSYNKYNHKYGYHAKKVVICDKYVKIHPNTHVDAVINPYNDFVIINKYALYEKPITNKPVCLNAYHECGYGSCHQANMHMGYSEFQNLLNTINNKAYASDKMSIAMMAIDNNFLMAAQVAELVSLMTYESDKVDLAKAAYHKTINKEDYYIVNKEFNYSSSINELENFIYAHK